MHTSWCSHLLAQNPSSCHLSPYFWSRTTSSSTDFLKFPPANRSSFFTLWFHTYSGFPITRQLILDQTCILNSLLVSLKKKKKAHLSYSVMIQASTLEANLALVRGHSLGIPQLCLSKTANFFFHCEVNSIYRKQKINYITSVITWLLWRTTTIKW